MCGIAGFSNAADRKIDASLVAKLFLAGLAERGEDASGYAWRDPATGGLEVVKRALPPHQFLASETVAMPAGTREAIVHVRDHTKGRPSHHGNNHPIRHGSICGVHNGIVQNDDELFEQFDRRRAMPGMTVDSEAIFMLFDTLDSPLEAFPHLVGSYSLAWFDEQRRDCLYGARGRGRPLVLGEGDGIALFASTRTAVRYVADRLGIDLAVRTVPFGTMVSLSHGAVVATDRFRVQPFTESTTASYSAESPNAALARRLAEQHVDQARGA